jgi:tRNA nucleotidyltransferase (CCA-adding enzyme)
MLNTALKVLKKIEDHGFKAYIVGGYVRDYLLSRESLDIDIATSATPMDIKQIFNDIFIPKMEYGSVTVFYHNIRFEITTFRKEYTYLNNRKPIDFEYINDLKEDLLRRDFIINTICMNSNGEIIDLLDGQKDLDKKEINTVGNSYEKFDEDSLRILRAIRFATILDFKLSDEVKDAIKNTKGNLVNLSYQRKKDELDKIFSSSNAKYGINLLKELELDKELEIYNLDEINLNVDIIGIWALLDTCDKYPFSKSEKELIHKIREAMDEDNLSNEVLYYYGLYVNSIAGVLKGIDKKKITTNYEKLPITNKKDINITSKEIMETLNKKSGEYIKDIYNDLTNLILNNKIENDNGVLKEYILKNY